MSDFFDFLPEDQPSPHDDPNRIETAELEIIWGLPVASRNAAQAHVTGIDLLDMRRRRDRAMFWRWTITALVAFWVGLGLVVAVVLVGGNL